MALDSSVWNLGAGDFVRGESEKAIRRSAQPVEFIETARRLLDAAGRSDVRIEVRRSQRRRADAGVDVVRVDRGMAGHPLEFQRWVAAHEAAHAVLRRGRRPIRLSLSWTGAWAGLVILARLATPPIPAIITAVVLLVGLGVVWLGMLHAIARFERPRERAADQLAARWGYPVTKSIVAVLVDAEGRWSSARIWLPFREHDLPRDRLMHDSR